MVVLLLLAIVAIIVSAFWNPPHVHLGWLGVGVLAVIVFLLPALGIR